MKRMLNRMLRYADAIVKRGVDKLIDAIAHNPEPQTKNAETPQPQKSMGNDTDCAPQTTGSTTNCDLAEQTISMTQTVCLRIVYAGICYISLSSLILTSLNSGYVCPARSTILA